MPKLLPEGGMTRMSAPARRWRIVDWHGTLAYGFGERNLAAARAGRPEKFIVLRGLLAERWPW